MSATASTLAVNVPDIGDFGEVPVIEILVSVGDTVAPEDPLVTLESDKATMDVPSPAGGTVKAIHVKVGDNVSEGSLVVELETAGGNASDSATSQETPAPAPEIVQATASESPVAQGTRIAAEADQPPSTPTPAPAPAAPSPNGDSLVYASPSVRRIARELGVDLHGVAGSGRKGRLTPADVRDAAAGGTSAERAPSPPTAAWPVSGSHPGRSWTSRSLAPSSASSARASRGSRRRTWHATG